MAKDPVCGMDVEEARAAATSNYEGTTYYFCNPGCKTTFDGDPAKYVAHGQGDAHGAGGRAGWVSRIAGYMTGSNRGCH